MRALFGLLIVGCVIYLVGLYGRAYWQRTVTPAVAAEAPEALSEPKSAPERSEKMVTFAGPLAEYVTRQHFHKGEAGQPPPPKLDASDYIRASPVGTSRPLLYKTFRVGEAIDLPFELPARAASAQLRGTYRAFAQGDADKETEFSDEDITVEFLLLNEGQYSDLLCGRPSSATFSADGAPEQEVNFRMPPTFDQPVKYYLVFRNSSPKTGKKVVQADFRIDF